MKKRTNLDKWYFKYQLKQYCGAIFIVIAWLACVIGIPVTIVWICAKFIFHLI